MTVTAVAPAAAGVQVGDFFVSSWGYDQTNVDYYKVVGLTPKGVKVQKWQSATESSAGSCDYMVPGAGPAQVTDWSACTREMDYWERKEAAVVQDAPVVTKRLSSYGGSSLYISVSSYSSASKWDGKPMYQTASGFGH